MTESNAGPAIGIDLGTSYCCVGVWKNDTVEIIPNDQGNRITPSYVAFTDTGRLIGDAAKNQVARNPENTVFDAKRLVGRKFSDRYVQSDMKHWPFRVTSGEGNKPFIEVRMRGEYKFFHPEEIEAMILQKMRDIAESYLGKTVKDAVITVPANFNISQRQATMDAGKIAGLNVLRLINEATAAAIAYGLDKKGEREENVLVFDLGGGTLDVSLLTINNGIIEVKATAGDTHLGGEDFDNRLVNFCIEDFKRKNRYKDISRSQRSLRRLRTQCERAKRILSSCTRAIIEVDSLYKGIDYSVTISRSRFEDLCMKEFRICIDIVENVLRDSKLNMESINEVILVGGSSRIPKIQQMITEFFNGKQLCMSLNPDEAVAYGAAAYAAVLSREDSSAIRNLILLDVAPLSLGIETKSGRMTVLIPRNHTIPVKKTHIFTANFCDQPSVLIQIFEGESHFTSDNNLLGQFKIDGIPPDLRSNLQIKVTFDIETNGFLIVNAVEMTTGKSNQITVTNEFGRLSPADVDRMAKKAEKFKAEDKKEKERLDAKNTVENYCFSVRRTMEEEKVKTILYVSEKEAVEKSINKMFTWLDQNRLAENSEIKEKLENVKKIWNPIKEKIDKAFGGDPGVGSLPDTPE